MPRKDTSSPVCMYDLTITANAEEDGVPVPEETVRQGITQFFVENCKKWCFQLEKGESGYLHYQCRVSLITKKRVNAAIAFFQRGAYMGSAHVSATSTKVAGARDLIYVTKADTRVKGPWDDMSHRQLAQIPDRFKAEPEWKSWQKTVLDAISQKADDRKVNVIINESGNIGKSFLCMWLGCRKRAQLITPMRDSKDVSRMVTCRLDPEKTGYVTNDIRCFFIDAPRADSDQKQESTFSAIESVKNGYVFDDRYSWRELYFNPPHVWVFTNHMPKSSLLSKDRWEFWEVNSKEELVPYSSPEEKEKRYGPSHEALLNITGRFGKEDDEPLYIGPCTY